MRLFLRGCIRALATILLVVGGLNWGLWGVLEFDLVATLFGGNTAFLSKIVYSLVGLAAIYTAFTLKGSRDRSASFSPARG